MALEARGDDLARVVSTVQRPRPPPRMTSPPFSFVRDTSKKLFALETGSNRPVIGEILTRVSFSPY